VKIRKAKRNTLPIIDPGIKDKIITECVQLYIPTHIVTSFIELHFCYCK
jgi:hypothetical protein